MEGAAMDFYEDDEPVEKIVAAFERGEKFVTAAPSTDPVRKLEIRIYGLTKTPSQGLGGATPASSAASENLKVSLTPAG